MNRYSQRRERGAAAVEMAIVLPMLLLVLGGIVDLGRALYGQVILTNAAREGARALSLGAADAETRARQSMTGFSPLVADSTTGVSFASTPCPGGNGTMIITVASGATGFRWYMLDTVPRLFGATIPTPTLKGEASMRCAT